MSSSLTPIRRYLRITQRFGAIAVSIVACLSEYLLDALTGRFTRARRPYPLHRASVRLLRWFGVSIECHGTPPASGLIVSNHLSYLDILVFSAVAPCAFVAKREVKAWPGVGWIATLAGAVYIDRSRRSATQAVQGQMAASLAAGVRLVLFPEGTSSDGRQILPFRSSLLQPAVENHAAITAACIAYEIEGGDPAVDVCYHGDMVMAPHAAKLFGKGPVKATLRFSATTKVHSDRKDAARELCDEIAILREQPESLAQAAAAPLPEPISQ